MTPEEFDQAFKDKMTALENSCKKKGGDFSGRLILARNTITDLALSTDSTGEKRQRYNSLVKEGARIFGLIDPETERLGVLPKAKETDALLFEIVASRIAEVAFLTRLQTNSNKHQ